MIVAIQLADFLIACSLSLIIYWVLRHYLGKTSTGKLKSLLYAATFNAIFIPGIIYCLKGGVALYFRGLMEKMLLVFIMRYTRLREHGLNFLTS